MNHVVHLCMNTTADALTMIMSRLTVMIMTVVLVVMFKHVYDYCYHYNPKP